MMQRSCAIWRATTPHRPRKRRSRGRPRSGCGRAELPRLLVRFREDPHRRRTPPPDPHARRQRRRRRGSRPQPGRAARPGCARRSHPTRSRASRGEVPAGLRARPLRRRGAHDRRGQEVPMSGPGTTHQVRSFGGGRVCVAGGCGTILSSYNPSSWCAVHDRLSLGTQEARDGPAHPLPYVRQPGLRNGLRERERSSSVLQRRLQRAGLLRAPAPRRRDRRSEVSPLNEGTHTYTRDQVLGAERWAWAGKLTAGRAEYFYDGIEFWLQEQGQRASGAGGRRDSGRGLVAQARVQLRTLPSAERDRGRRRARRPRRRGAGITGAGDGPARLAGAAEDRRETPASPLARGALPRRGARERPAGPAPRLRRGPALPGRRDLRGGRELRPSARGLSPDPASRRDPRDGRRHRLRLAPRRPLRLPLLLEGRTTRRSGSIGRVVSVRETGGER